MILVSMQSINAQVFTRYLLEGQRLEDFITFPLEKEIIYYLQPEVDFNLILQEDRRSNNPLSRVAVKVDQNYNVDDGIWIQYGDIMIWQIGFSAPKASSLNFLVKDLILPKDAELFVLSKEGNIVHGPVTSDVIYKNLYSTDIIESSDVMVVMKTDIARFKSFNLTINGVCQGIPRLQKKLMSFGDASDCNFDVNCPIGNGWQDERDAVAFVLRNGESHCSGVLINNQCQDTRPFFLTAFHCLDTNIDGQLSVAEQNLGIYTFRFKYEAGTPTCPGNSTGTQGVWITYSGAAFRAANAATDFALIELNGSVINQPNIALAGWNRNSNIFPQLFTSIHHPRGDAKKISNDNEPLITTNPNMWIIERWDNGLVEPGSSGSPLFDNNRRIIGQLDGGNNNIGCDPITGESFVDSNRYGRFNLSWIGNGTNQTRLSNWLGAINPPITMNSIRPPWINPWVSNNTQEYVCTNNKVFTLNNPIPGKNVTWSVSNPTLFATNNGAATSGTGTIVTLRAVSAGASGNAVLTFTLTQNECNSVVVTRNIWVGRPGLPITSPNGTVPIEIGITQYHTVYLSSAPGASSFIADWAVSGAVSRVGGNFPAIYATHVGNYVGSGNWQVTTSNICGTKTNSGQYNVTTNSCNPCPRIIVNNPVQDILVAQIPDYNLPVEINIGDKELHGDFILLDQNGVLIKTEKFIGTQHSTNVFDIKSGLYFIKMKNKDINLTEKVIVIK